MQTEIIIVLVILFAILIYNIYAYITIVNNQNECEANTTSKSNTLAIFVLSCLIIIILMGVLIFKGDTLFMVPPPPPTFTDRLIDFTQQAQRNIPEDLIRQYGPTVLDYLSRFAGARKAIKRFAK